MPPSKIPTLTRTRLYAVHAAQLYITARRLALLLIPLNRNGRCAARKWKHYLVIEVDSDGLTGVGATQKLRVITASTWDDIGHNARYNVHVAAGEGDTGETLTAVLEGLQAWLVGNRIDIRTLNAMTVQLSPPEPVRACSGRALPPVCARPAPTAARGSPQGSEEFTVTVVHAGDTDWAKHGVPANTQEAEAGPSRGMKRKQREGEGPGAAEPAKTRKSRAPRLAGEQPQREQRARSRQPGARATPEPNVEPAATAARGAASQRQRQRSTSRAISLDRAASGPAAVADVQAHRREMHAQSAAHREEVEAVEARLAAAHRTDVEAVEARLAAAHRTDVEAVEARLAAAHRTDVEAVEARLAAAHREKVEAVEARLAAAHREKVEAVEARLAAAHRTDVEAVEARLAAVHRTDVEAVEARLAAAHREKVEAVEARLVGLEDQQQQLKAQQQQLGEAHATAEAARRELARQAALLPAQLEARAEALRQATRAAESRLDFVEQLAARHQQETRALEPRVAAVEGLPPWLAPLEARLEQHATLQQRLEGQLRQLKQVQDEAGTGQRAVAALQQQLEGQLRRLGQVQAVAETTQRAQLAQLLAMASVAEPQAGAQ